MAQSIEPSSYLIDIAEEYVWPRSMFQNKYLWTPTVFAYPVREMAWFILDINLRCQQAGDRQSS